MNEQERHSTITPYSEIGEQLQPPSLNRALVVEDSDLAFESMRDRLLARGILPIRAKSSDEAISLLKESQKNNWEFDLFLFDTVLGKKKIDVVDSQKGRKYTRIESDPDNNGLSLLEKIIQDENDGDGFFIGKNVILTQDGELSKKMDALLTQKSNAYREQRIGNINIQRMTKSQSKWYTEDGSLDIALENLGYQKDDIWNGKLHEHIVVEDALESIEAPAGFEKMIDQLPEPFLQMFEYIENLGGAAFLVGGSVRDIVHTCLVSEAVAQNYVPNPVDFDVVVFGIDEVALTQIFEAIYGSDNVSPVTSRVSKEGAEYPLSLKLQIPGVEHSIDITVPRQVVEDDIRRREVAAPYGQMHDDMERRDSSVNGLFVGLTKKPAVIYGPHGSIEDVKNGILRPTNPEYFKEDPNRMYRAIVQAVELGFDFSDEMKTVVTKMVAEGMFDRLSNKKKKLLWQKVLLGTDSQDQAQTILETTGLEQKVFGENTCMSQQGWDVMEYANLIDDNENQIDATRLYKLMVLSGETKLTDEGKSKLLDYLEVTPQEKMWIDAFEAGSKRALATGSGESVDARLRPDQYRILAQKMSALDEEWIIHTNDLWRVTVPENERISVQATMRAILIEKIIDGYMLADSPDFDIQNFVPELELNELGEKLKNAQDYETVLVLLGVTAL